MESNWRYYWWWGGMANSSIFRAPPDQRLLAQLVTSSSPLFWQFISNYRGSGSPLTCYRVTYRKADQVLWDITQVSKLNPALPFPYGYAVYPDTPGNGLWLPVG